MSPYFSSVIILLCLSVSFNIFLWLANDSWKKYSLFNLDKIKPFKKKDRLMSPNELKLFNILRNFESLKNYDIFPQVPYSSIIDVDPNEFDLGMRFEIINNYRCDFVIVEKSRTKVELVVELNDLTHNYSYRKARDLFIYSALKSAGQNFIVFETKDLVNQEVVESRINHLLKSKTT